MGIETIHNQTLTELEPFQSLVSKIQKEIDPSITSSSDSEIDHNNNPKTPSTKTSEIKRKNSIKMKKSELNTIHDMVNEHRNKMKEKTYQYEEKKKTIKL